MGCCVTIPQGTIGILENCGSFSGEMDPGCHFLVPCVHNVAYKFNMRQKQVVINVDTKTKDDVFCNIKLSIFYAPTRNKIQDLAYGLTKPEAMMSSIVQNVVRTSLAILTLEEAFLQKSEISNSVKDQLTNNLSKFGITFNGVMVDDVEPAKEVRDAMNEINKQTKLKVAAYEAAESKKITVVKAAEADAESKRLSGIGTAEQRKAIVNGFKSSIEEFQESVPGTSPSDIMRIVLMGQYFDTLKELAHNSKSNTIFVPHNPSTVMEVDQKLAYVSASNLVDIQSAKK